ncbi:uncharacterized protein LOC131325963 [Rhododendron vialii]|uniref:uncharacterized protein LOC131325963 n=1 Tax=Rhododendron vialii TaxID=182163 RepID=UPI00265D6278|nr:uncharacterized protein LOC131325963 [Rhododendron vialii]
MSQGENDFEKDLKHLTSTIAGNISEGAEKAEYFFSSACIFRVPEDLRKLNERAYTPRLIAIGPLHREDEHLQTPLQHVKPSYTNYLLSRLTAGMEDQLELAKQKKLTVLQECLAELKTSIDDAKKCYAAEVTLDEEIMLVDSCFILEFLYRARLLHFTKWAEENENMPNDGGDNSNSKVSWLLVDAIHGQNWDRTKLVDWNRTDRETFGPNTDFIFKKL